MSQITRRFTNEIKKQGFLLEEGKFERTSVEVVIGKLNVTVVDKSSDNYTTEFFKFDEIGLKNFKRHIKGTLKSASKRLTSARIKHPLNYN